MSKKGHRQRQRLQASAPPSGQPPLMNLAPREVEAMAEELVTYHAMFHDLFQRREQREWSAFYLRGQLSDLERKTVEPMVLATHGPDAAAVRVGQQFLGQGAWEDTAILARHQRLVAESLGEPDGVVIFDGSGFPKRGTHSVMPETWFDKAHTPLRQRYGVPGDLTFQTEWQLALDMLDGLVERATVPFSWVVADEHYGMIPCFLDGVEARGKWYFAEVPTSTPVWVGEPQVKAPGQGALGRPRKHRRVADAEAKAQEVAQIATQLPAEAWQRYTIKEGSKDPIEAQFAFVRVTRARRGRPGALAWAVFRRSTAETHAVKIFLYQCPCYLST